MSPSESYFISSHCCVVIFTIHLKTGISEFPLRSVGFRRFDLGTETQAIDYVGYGPHAGRRVEIQHAKPVGLMHG